MEYDNLPWGDAQMDGAAACDREVFERVWRRVMPEDRPDCPFVLEGDPPAETAVGTDGSQLPVPRQGSPAPLRMGDTYPAEEPDVPCLGAASAVYTQQMQRFIEGELADWKLYQALARRAGSGGRALSAIAADERRHAKRLSTAYFLITGVRYWPMDRVAASGKGNLAAALRQRFADEQRGAAAYLAAAEDTADTCLRDLYLELAGEEDTHTWMIRGLLEQM